MSELRPAPYPADTRSKGWRFELDLERVEQSDTWALAAADVRPWLFLLWAKSWQQVPCGSLPSDDALIAARIGMAPKMFAKVRAVLLRGWWLADDGRLYHDVIAARVQAMLGAKAKESQRKAEYRARMDAERAQASADVPRDKEGTDAGRHPPSSGCDDTGTGTGTSREKRNTFRPATRVGQSASDSRPEPPPDTADVIFALGVPMLTAAGVADRSARSMLGLQRKQHGDQAVIAALQRCADEKPLQPVPWLQATLKAAATPPKVNRQMAIEAENRRVAEAWLQGETR